MSTSQATASKSPALPETSSPPFEVYRPGLDGDFALLHFYARLVADGDLDKLLGSSVHPLAAFMKHFTDPQAIVFYLADDKGWWTAAWLFPMAGGGAYGLWLREDKRAAGSRKAMNFIMETLAVGLTRYPVLVNATHQEDVVAKTERLGYTYVGKIPFLFDGKDCHLLRMTGEQFWPRFERWKKAHHGRG